MAALNFPEISGVRSLAIGIYIVFGRGLFRRLSGSGRGLGFGLLFIGRGRSDI